MSLLISLHSELVKTKRTSTLYVCCIAATIIPLVTLLFDYGSAEGINHLKQDPWNKYLIGNGEMLSIVFLPMFIVIICTLLPQMEYRNNSWKQVLVSPQLKRNVYFSKFLTTQLFIILFILLYNLLMAISLVVLHHFKGNVQLYEHHLNWTRFLLHNAQVYVSILGISAIQFWFGLKFKNFIVPIALGFCFWVAAVMMLDEFKWADADKFPFATPMLAIFPKYKYMLPFLLWSSFGYAIFFLLIGFLDFKRKKVSN